MAGIGVKGSGRAKTIKLTACALATQALLDVVQTGLQELIDRLELRL